MVFTIVGEANAERLSFYAAMSEPRMTGPDRKA
jgi:hypothetical protein